MDMKEVSPEKKIYQSNRIQLDKMDKKTFNWTIQDSPDILRRQIFFLMNFSSLMKKF